MDSSLWQDRSEEAIDCCLLVNSLLESRRCSPGNRCALATTDIPAGRIIVRNTPMAFCVHDRDDRCASCFRKCKLLRCGKCQQTWYCSRECQVQDFPSHRIECRERSKLLGREEWQRNARLLVRVFVKLYTTETDSCRLVMADTETNSPTCTCSRRHFMQLRPFRADKDLYELRILETVSEILINRSKILMKMNIDLSNDIESLKITLEYLLRRFRCNNFGMVDSMVRLVGSGVYPLGALLNHSCAPNCIIRYTNHGVMEIVAARDIARGDELTHSYVELVSSSHQRKAHLQDIYGFDCTCVSCQRLLVSLPWNYEHLRTETLMQWILDRYNPHSPKNPVMDGLGLPSKSVIEIPLDDLLVPSAMNKNILYQVRTLQQQAGMAMADDDVWTELDCLTSAESLLLEQNTQCFVSLSKDLYQILCQELSCLIVTQQCKEALEVCTRIVAILCLALHKIPKHPLLGLQLFTLGDLYQENGQICRASVIYRWAFDVLLISQGQASDMVQMLREKLA